MQRGRVHIHHNTVWERKVNNSSCKNSKIYIVDAVRQKTQFGKKSAKVVQLLL
jgi:hypothetical protein